MAYESKAPMGKPLGSQETLLINNAALVDVANSKIFDETAILIRGGKIEKLIVGEAVSNLNADRKIDAGGRYLIPGLINAHCHICLPGVMWASLSIIMNLGKQMDRSCADSITHGVTTIRDQVGRQDAIINRQKRIERGELMGPRILRSIAIDVPKGYMDYPGLMKFGSILVKDVAQAKDAVAKAVDMGADHIKVPLQYHDLMQSEKPLPMLSDEMLAAIVEKAAELEKTIAVHQTSIDGFRRAVRAGIQSLEHWPIDGPLNDDDIKMFKDGGHALVPTISVAWALSYPLKGDKNFEHPMAKKWYKHKQDNIISFLDEFALPKLAKVGRRVYKMYSRPGYFDKKHRILMAPSARIFNSEASIGVDNMMRMYEEGCRIGCGNDGGTPFVWPGMMHHELYLRQDAGMKPGDVLKSATQINAEVIGMADSLGTLDSGKIADIVLLDANPLENIQNTSKVAGVLQSGRLVHATDKVKEVQS